MNWKPVNNFLTKLNFTMLYYKGKKLLKSIWTQRRSYEHNISVFTQYPISVCHTNPVNIDFIKTELSQTPMVLGKICVFRILPDYVFVYACVVFISLLIDNNNNVFWYCIR